MKDILSAAVKNVTAIGAAASIIFVCGAPIMASNAASQPESCASALAQGIDLLGHRQFSQAEDVLTGAAKSCPREAEIFETLGLAYDFQGRPAEAQAAYRRAISIDPQKVESHNNLAVSLLRSGQQDAAIEEFHRALRIDPANKTANVNLATLQIGRGDYASALHFLKSANIERSQDPMALFQLTQAYYGLGENRAARDTATRLAKVPELEPAMHFSLGLQLAEHGDYELAAQQFRAIPEADRDAASDINLGMACSKLRRFQEARQAYDSALRRDPSNPDAYLHIGLDAAAAGNQETALDWMTQAYNKAPNRPDILYALLRQLVHVGNFERARALLDPASAARPGDPDLCEIHGDLLLREGRPEQAVEAYRRVLTLQPRRVSTRIALASAYERLQQGDKAKDELEYAVRSDPHSADAKAQLGHLAIEEGKLDVANAWTRQALALDSNNLTANENHARLLERAGRHEEARALLEKLARLEPKNPRIHYLLGRVLLQLRKTDEAQTEFELSKKLEASQAQHGE